MEKEGKTILLIIDPQKDFTDDNRATLSAKAPYSGTLQVTGARADYVRIGRLIDETHGESNDGTPFAHIDEIHVSLDTHTINHIGHYGYWQVDKADGNGFVDAVNIIDDWPLLIINDKGEITSEKPSQNKYTYRAKNPDLREYTMKYLQKHNQVKGVSVIWAQHCIEKSSGHQVADILKKSLDDFSKLTGKPVKYHIKGQNELSEMYSIFGAVVPVEEVDVEISKNIDLCYSDGKNMSWLKNNFDTSYDRAKGCNTYEDVITKINLDTSINDGLMETLLNGGKNKVLVCGEARTHCVKSSMEHLVQYAKNKQYPISNIMLLVDGSSPILPPEIFKDDLGDLIKAEGGKVVKIMIPKDPTNPTSVGKINEIELFGTNLMSGGRRTRKNKLTKIVSRRLKKKIAKRSNTRRKTYRRKH
jgi:nicotinamidase-related amidase